MFQPLKVQLDLNDPIDVTDSSILPSVQTALFKHSNNSSQFYVIMSLQADSPNEFRFERSFETSTPHLEANAILSLMFLNLFKALGGQSGDRRGVVCIGDFVEPSGVHHVGTFMMNYVYDDDAETWNYTNTYFQISTP